MYSRPVSRRLVIISLMTSLVGLAVSTAGAGDFRHEPRSATNWPRNLIRSVQSRLKELGFEPGPIDGVYGPQTKKAIMEFQQSKDLQVDGKISDGLIGELKLG